MKMAKLTQLMLDTDAGAGDGLSHTTQGAGAGAGGCSWKATWPRSRKVATSKSWA